MTKDAKSRKPRSESLKEYDDVVGPIVRKVRETHTSYGVKEFGKLMGYTGSNWSLIENGKAPIKMHVFLKTVEILGEPLIKAFGAEAEKIADAGLARVRDEYMAKAREAQERMTKR